MKDASNDDLEDARIRDNAIEECAALMDRWAKDAKGFDDANCVVYLNTCRSAAKAIRRLSSYPGVTRGTKT